MDSIDIFAVTQKGMDDTISRQAAIRWVKTECNPYGKPTLDFESGKKVIEHLKQMPSAQPELIEKTAYIRGFEQGRTQGMIDAKVEKLGSSAQPEIVHCKDCKHYIKSESYCDYLGITISDHDFCSFAERRTDEQTVSE